MEEPRSVFRQNPFCQRENSDKNESNDGLHKKWTSNKNEPIFRPSQCALLGLPVLNPGAAFPISATWKI
jgi:hypothetical protein